MRFKSLFAGLFLAFLYGCTSTSSVMPLGQGDYTITVTGGNEASNKAKAYKIATYSCTKTQRAFLYISDSSERSVNGIEVITTLRFKCTASGSAESSKKTK